MFEPIPHTKLKKDGEPLSKFTLKLYKRLLNRLADAGYDTIHSLILNAPDVVELIDIVVDGDTDTHRAEKRKYLSAIFYALDTTPLGLKTAYYQAFQTAKQNYGKD